MTIKEKFDSIIYKIEELVGSGQNDIHEITTTVSQSTGIEIRRLSDAFHFMTDSTIGNYIKSRLLVHALEIKLEEERSIEDVCGLAGLIEAASFTRVCQNLLGCSPSQFTREMLSKHSPLFFDRLIAGNEADQVEIEALTTTNDTNTICGVSVAQFADIKQVLELSAIYGFTDEESEFVYQLATNGNLTLAKAAEFFDDFKLQIENGSNIPGMDIFEMAELACKYDLSYSEAQAIMYELSCHGYLSIRDLPTGFFDIYFCDENDRCGWDVPYICEIAEAIEENRLSTADIDDIAFHASMFGVDIVEAIENYDEYESSWDNMVNEAMTSGVPEDDTGGFGYRSIWELPEE